MTYLFRIPLLFLLLCAALPLSVGVAGANDLQQTFNFGGTLLSPVNGSTSVTGQFTLDFSTASIGAFDFITPLQNITSTLSPGLISELAGTNPNTAFTDLTFGTPFGAWLDLLFESPLSAFASSSFYTDAVTVTFVGLGVVTDSSGLKCYCTLPGGVDFTEVDFSSGAVTPLASTAPEPRPALLLMSCCAFLCLIERRRILSGTRPAK